MKICGHQQVDREHPNYLGSSWNLLILWEDGSKTWEPLDVMAKDIRDECVLYAVDNSLMNKDGWKRFCRYAKNKKVLARRAKQQVLKTMERGASQMATKRSGVAWSML